MFDQFTIRSSCRAVRLSAAAFASLVVASVALVAAPLHAASYNWVVFSGDWSVASNWGGTLPGSSDCAYVVNGGTVNVTQFGGTCGTLSLGSGAGSETVQQTAGNLSTDFQYVAFSGTGTFTQSGGINSINSYLFLGNNTGSSGMYNLGGNSLLSISGYGEWVGVSGSGTLTQFGGTNSASRLNLATITAAAAPMHKRQRPVVGLFRVRGQLWRGRLHPIRWNEQRQ